MGGRRIVMVAGALLLAVATGGLLGWAVRGSDRADSRSSASPSPSPVAKPVVDGHLTFTVLEFGCGLIAVQGTHSEGMPEGQFCRVTLRVDNHDPAYHDYVARSQHLSGVAAPRNRPDTFAMAVRRQPETIRIGGHNAVEVELWYDVPKQAQITGLRLAGDRDPVAYKSDDIVPHRPGGVPVRVKPADESP